MAVLIKDEEADRLIRELAGRTGETITDAVKKAVVERLKTVPRSPADIAARKRKLAALLAYFDKLPVDDPRAPNESDDYDDFGLPK